MTNKEKCEVLRPAITNLYSKEGRSKSYISRTLGINRKTVSEMITIWDLRPAEPRRHMSKSTKKFLDANKERIQSRLEHGHSICQIASELHVDRKKIQTIISYDETLSSIWTSCKEKKKEDRENLVKGFTDASSRQYEYDEIKEEEWRPIKGHEPYEVSNKGRIRGYAKRYKKHYLMRLYPNPDTGRLYVKLPVHGKKNYSKNLQVARLVGFAFVPGHSEENNTIDHEDGDIENNDAENLTWKSQGKNNEHAYRELNQSVVNKKCYHFKKILYKNKYEFSTVSAFAKFIGKSETQTRRYMDEPKKHDIVLIK